MAPPVQFDIICCSLEPWDEVWRRNQHLTAELLRLRPTMRVLFAEPPVDMAWSLRQGRRPAASGLRSIGDSGRLWAMAPRKWLPRRIWPDGDRSLARQVMAAGNRLGFDRPLLWINDSIYAPLVESTGWPSVYDVTDDWLLGAGGEREMERLRDNDARMLRSATEVVVCSPALEASRGRERLVHLVSNGVDVDHLRAPTSRPTDLPDGPDRPLSGHPRRTAGWIWTSAWPPPGAVAADATLVFVGPNSLTRASEPVTDRCRCPHPR